MLAAAAARHIAARSRPLAAAIACLLIFAKVSSARSFPDYLAYSNEAFGGLSNTYRVVTDANADWGQGLKWVKKYLDSNHISDCWFDYNVPFVDPKYYKIPCKQLPLAMNVLGLAPMPPIPASISGTILISATEAEGLHWGPDSLNPYQQFTRRRPDAVIGNIILVYKGKFDVPLLSAMSHAASARSLLARKNVPEALAEAHTAVNQAPDSAVIHFTLGQILMTVAKREEALQSFATALRIARTNHPDFQKPLVRIIGQVSR